MASSPSLSPSASAGPDRSPGPACPIGAHVPVAGGLATGGLRYAAEIGAESVQVFVTNPRGWALAAGRPAEDERLRTHAAEHDTPVFVHANYLINLGSPNPATLASSVASLRHTLVRAAAIGARGVVVHTGSAVSRPREEAMRQVREQLRPILDEIPDDGPDLLLEPMAGQGAMLCATVFDLGPYLDNIDRHPRAGVCLDTCHAFAAGHDLSTPAGVAQTLDALAETAGADRLKLIHANDSMDVRGSAKDRHANIGAGHIGAEPFGELFRHPVSRGVPVIIETPGRSPEPHRADIDTLKALRDGKKKPGCY